MVSANTYDQWNRRKRVLWMLAAAFVCTLLLFVTGISLERAEADQLSPAFASTDGSSCTDISDGDYFTTEYFDPGTEITLTSDTAIDSLYIIWEAIPGSWTLDAGGQTMTCGQDGYLHEFIKLPAGTSYATICVGSERLTIADVYAFSGGELPAFVQTWEAPYEEADILLVSTHADDEVLFFGGIIPNYTDRGDVRVQVAYFTDLFQSETYRNHEILNGLWHMGVTHYPQLGEFYDYYSESYEEAVEQYNYYQSLEYMVRTIRRFKPQVLIGQDPQNGEYGHGGHMWCARVLEDAVEVSGDPEVCPESAEQYGTWDVPKTYFHLWPENTLVLDARTPLSSFGGKTEIEVAKEAYEEHQSQQWCWFYVSDGYDEEGNPDGYEYSCTKYGLYRTLVGQDTGANDLMENLVSYDAQEVQAAQAKAAEEEASRAAEEAAKKAAEAQTSEEAVTAATAQSVLDPSNPTAVPGGKNTTAITILIILAVIVVLIMIGLIVISRSRKKMKEKERRLERSRREAENRARGRYTSSVSRSSVGYRSTSSGSRSRSAAAGRTAGSRQGTDRTRPGTSQNRQRVSQGVQSTPRNTQNSQSRRQSNSRDLYRR